MSKLREVMLHEDLEEVTSRQLRLKLEKEVDMQLSEYREFLDRHMLRILGQMEQPSEILDYLYLVSESEREREREREYGGRTLCLECGVSWIIYVQGGRHSRGFESHLRQLILLWKSDSFGCALPCLFDFSSFLLHLSRSTCTCTCIHVHVHTRQCVIAVASIYMYNVRTCSWSVTFM